MCFATTRLGLRGSLLGNAASRFPLDAGLFLWGYSCRVTERLLAISRFAGLRLLMVFLDETTRVGARVGLLASTSPDGILCLGLDLGLAFANQRNQLIGAKDL